LFDNNGPSTSKKLFGEVTDIEAESSIYVRQPVLYYLKSVPREPGKIPYLTSSPALKCLPLAHTPMAASAEGFPHLFTFSIKSLAGLKKGSLFGSTLTFSVVLGLLPT